MNDFDLNESFLSWVIQLCMFQEQDQLYNFFYSFEFFFRVGGGGGGEFETSQQHTQFT